MFTKNRLVIVILGIMTMMVCATSTQAQNFAGTVSVPSSVSFIDHRVLPGESCELITRRYYGVEDAGLLLPENPWLAPRPVWTKNGLSFRIHPGEYIRIRWAGSPLVVQQPQQPIQILENSFMSTPAFWIGFGILTIMLITLSIIVGILWGGRRVSGIHESHVFNNNTSQPEMRYNEMHHTHEHQHQHQHQHKHTSVVEVKTESPVVPGGGGGGGPQAQNRGGGNSSSVGFKSEKECGQGKG
jgi:hypothetical protein